MRWFPLPSSPIMLFIVTLAWFLTHNPRVSTAPIELAATEGKIHAWRGEVSKRMFISIWDTFLKGRLPTELWLVQSTTSVRGRTKICHGEQDQDPVEDRRVDLRDEKLILRKLGVAAKYASLITFPAWGWSRQNDDHWKCPCNSILVCFTERMVDNFTTPRTCYY